MLLGVGTEASGVGGTLNGHPDFAPGLFEESLDFPFKWCNLLVFSIETATVEMARKPNRVGRCTMQLSWRKEAQRPREFLVLTRRLHGLTRLHVGPEGCNYPQTALPGKMWRALFVNVGCMGCVRYSGMGRSGNSPRIKYSTCQPNC